MMIIMDNSETRLIPFTAEAAASANAEIKGLREWVVRLQDSDAQWVILNGEQNQRIVELETEVRDLRDLLPKVLQPTQWALTEEEKQEAATMVECARSLTGFLDWWESVSEPVAEQKDGRVVVD